MLGGRLDLGEAREGGRRITVRLPLPPDADEDFQRA